MEWTQATQLTGVATPYIGNVIDVGFEAAQAIVVLLTPDDIAYLRPEYAGDGDPDCEPSGQARPNVLFEAGMAMGRQPARTVLVELGQVRAFTDVAGRHVLRLDNSAAKRREVGTRLGTAGCSVDWTGEDWMTAGDLMPPSAPGAGLPLGRRLPSAALIRGPRVDVRYHGRSSGGTFQVVNRGNEDLYDVDLTLPPEASSYSLLTDELPIAQLPGGRSVNIPCAAFSGGGKSNFHVTVTARTSEGDPVDEQVFVSAS